MKIIEIKDINTPELKIYTSLTEAELRRKTEYKTGIFIAESPKVIHIALSHGYEPISLLCERKHITGDAADIITSLGDVPVYTGEREILASLTGYTLTRGVLCAMRRKSEISLDDLLAGARLICVLHGVCDTTNIGAIFRSASALGVDAMVLSEDSCDPLNRRAIRVSMGTVFTIPWVKIKDPVDKLKQAGFATIALALRNDSYTIDSPVFNNLGRIAVVLGTEGDGLPQRVINSSDYVVKIPMHHGVDSLNVGAAAAITFWELGKNRNNK